MNGQTKGVFPFAYVRSQGENYVRSGEFGFHAGDAAKMIIVKV